MANTLNPTISYNWNSKSSCILSNLHKGNLILHSQHKQHLKSTL